MGSTTSTQKYIFFLRFRNEPIKDMDIISLEHFDVQRVLGKGGFGTVNAVVKRSHPHKGKWYALKTMNKLMLLQSNQGESTLSCIFAERNILTMVHHPYLYAFQDEKNIYLVMDIALGGDLRYQLKQTKNGFDENRARFYIAQLILALECLHSNRILHRDIKPENLLLEADGYCKLSDFGLSRQVPNHICDETGGTLTYMAPEIYFTSTHYHSYTSDWWSVGIVTLEFLTRLVPYKYKTLISMDGKNAFKHLRISKHHGPVAQALDKVSPEAKDFVFSLLHITPKHRLGYKSVDELKNHKWFKNIAFNWKALEERKFAPIPFIPEVTHANCDSKFDMDVDKTKEMDPMKRNLLMSSHVFDGYEYNIYNNPKKNPSNAKLIGPAAKTILPPIGKKKDGSESGGESGKESGIEDGEEGEEEEGAEPDYGCELESNFDTMSTGRLMSETNSMGDYETRSRNRSDGGTAINTKSYLSDKFIDVSRNSSARTTSSPTHKGCIRVCPPTILVKPCSSALHMETQQAQQNSYSKEDELQRTSALTDEERQKSSELTAEDVIPVSIAHPSQVPLPED